MKEIGNILLRMGVMILTAKSEIRNHKARFQSIPPLYITSSFMFMSIVDRGVDFTYNSNAKWRTSPKNEKNIYGITSFFIPFDNGIVFGL